AVIGGWSAAYLHGEHWFSADNGRGVVDVFTSLEPRVPRGVRERKLSDPVPATDVCELGGLRVTSPARTAVDVARWSRGVDRPTSHVAVLLPSVDLVTAADLANIRDKVAIFYDGKHHGDPGQCRRDIRINARLADLGWQVARIAQGMSVNEVIRHIELALARARRQRRS